MEDEARTLQTTKAISFSLQGLEYDWRSSLAFAALQVLMRDGIKSARVATSARSDIPDICTTTGHGANGTREVVLLKHLSNNSAGDTHITQTENVTHE